MRRSVFNLLAVVSLAVCVGSGALWGASSIYGLTIQKEWRTGHTAALRVSFGEISLEARSAHGRTLVQAKRLDELLWVDPANLIFGFAHEKSGAGDAWYAPLWLPMWSGFIAAVLLYGRGRPTPSGLCASCGYDLRASPGRCPECGVKASVKPAIALAARVE